MKIKKQISLGLLMIIIVVILISCNKQEEEETYKIGVSLGVLSSDRWLRDKAVMEETAKDLGIELLVNMSDADWEKQYQACLDLMDQGISVLIITPSNGIEAAKIADIARERDIKVISYDRLVLGTAVDLIITSDSEKVGENQGMYLAETKDKGNYVILSGDSSDANAALLLKGAMKYIQPLVDKKDVNIIVNESVAKWSPAVAKEITQKALKDYNNQIDAILAPNDKIAQGCIEALEEVGLAGKVTVTGMDADSKAAQRIVKGTQDMTVFKDNRVLAKTAIEQSLKMAKGEKPNINAELDVQASEPVQALLLEAQLITKKNLDKELIDSGYLSKDEVYIEK